MFVLGTGTGTGIGSAMPCVVKRLDPEDACVIGQSTLL